jgi:glyoxylase-like metal-dependent hydrolase (beta-lactamase superfamily II)/rhodanese-related sulfurtransferase
MLIEQIISPSLSECTYYIECQGEAVVIDPIREPQPYLLRAGKSKAKIRYIFETHVHADFIGGHAELAEQTGASIVFGPTATPMFPATIATDQQVFPLGDCFIKVLHTPGHSLESVCYLLMDARQQPKALFTGDTLLMNDVGRVDIIQHVRKELTPRFMAGLLYDSLHNQLLTLPDDLPVYPGHTEGSACGKRIDPMPSDTLGRQRNSNPYLHAGLNRNEFIERVLENRCELPPNFPFNILLNLNQELPRLQELLQQGSRGLAPDVFASVWMEEQAVVLDTRAASAFEEQYIPGSVYVGEDDRVENFIRELLTDLRQPILLIAAPREVSDWLVRLSRIGYQYPLGYLKGGVKAWAEAGMPVASVSKDSPSSDVSQEKIEVAQWVRGSVDNRQAQRLPMHGLKKMYNDRYRSKHCALIGGTVCERYYALSALTLMGAARITWMPAIKTVENIL